MTITIHPEISTALDKITVTIADDDFRATVGPRRLEGDSVAHLRARMIGAVYEVIHTGREEQKDLGRIRRERAVEELLRDAMPHSTTPRPARVVSIEDESAVVDLGDVRVRIQRSAVPQEASDGDVVELDLPAARPGLSHGFFMIDGPIRFRRASGAMRRVYLHAPTPEAAAGAWGPVLTALNEAGVPYRSKALSHRDGYPRRDAIVVYLDIEDAGVVPTIAQAAARTGLLRDDVSAFAEKIAPGVGVADEPADARPRHSGLSFGEHRATALTDAILRSATEEGVDLLVAVAEEFRAAGIDLAAPAFNVPVVAAKSAA